MGRHGTSAEAISPVGEADGVVKNSGQPPTIWTQNAHKLARPERFELPTLRFEA